MIVPAAAAILKNRTAYQFFCDGRGADMVFLSTLTHAGYAAHMCVHATCSMDRVQYAICHRAGAWSFAARRSSREERDEPSEETDRGEGYDDDADDDRDVPSREVCQARSKLSISWRTASGDRNRSFPSKCPVADR
jgi:hypothetical protein